jgi:hypothetical protein
MPEAGSPGRKSDAKGGLEWLRHSRRDDRLMKHSRLREALQPHKVQVKTCPSGVILKPAGLKDIGVW